MREEAKEPKITNERSQVDRVRELLNTGTLPEEDERKTATGETPDDGSDTQGAPQGAEQNERAPTQEAATETEVDADQDHDNGEIDAEETSAPALTLEAIAEKAGITMEQLYQAQVKLGDGRDPESLSAVVDGRQSAARVQERHDKADSRERELDTRQDDVERGAMRDRQEMGMLMSVVRKENIPPEVMEHLAANQRRQQAEQHQAVLARFPQFKDRVKYTQWAEKAGAMLGKEFGYRPSELSNVRDVRMFDLVDKHMQLLERVETTQTALEDARKQLRKARRATGDQARPRANGATRPKRTTAAARERDVSSQVHETINRALRS